VTSNYLILHLWHDDNRIGGLLQCIYARTSVSETPSIDKKMIFYWRRCT